MAFPERHADFPKKGKLMYAHTTTPEWHKRVVEGRKRQAEQKAQRLAKSAATRAANKKRKASGRDTLDLMGGFQ